MEIDDFTQGMRRERAFYPLLALFFISGATGLTWQTVWARELHLLFGTSTLAIATVLTSFMGGMALGGALLGRWADRVSRPLEIYGLLEVGIGLYALAFPALVGALVPVYLAAAGAPGPAVAALQLGLAFAALVFPTAAMGATLPLLARFSDERLGGRGRRVGVLYAVNTAGAVVGTWAAGFLLLPSLGLSQTSLLAAAANLTLGLGALGLGRWAGPSEAVATQRVRGDAVAWGVGLSLALAGFASLVYEVAWTRLLALMLGGSTYAFSLMLLAFLTGIALGGHAGGALADKVFAFGGRRGTLLALAALEIGVGAAAWALTWGYAELPFLYVYLYDLVNAEIHPRGTWIISLALSGVMMTPPAVLMGAAFPVAVRAAAAEGEGLGAPVGRLYAWNTVGSMFGAATAGFLLLPALWVRGTVSLGIGVNLAAAALLLALGRGRWGWAALGAVGLAAVALRPHWDPLLMTAGMYKYVSALEDHSREGVLRYATQHYELLYYAEGLSSVVTVAANTKTRNIWLANNGKVEASTTVDMPTQLLVSLLPFQFAEQPKKVMVIGLASGITAGALTLIDALDEIEVVELEPAIVPAAEIFAPHNYGVLSDPRVRLTLNDGRNQLLLTPPGTLDVVVSEPSNPWISGVSNLFTEEFFRLGKSRLREGGVWSQWVQLYGMDPQDLKSLLATFGAVYPHVLVYATVQDADVVLLGSDRPLSADLQGGYRLFAQSERVRQALAQVKVEKPIDLMALLQLDRAQLDSLSRGAEHNTDDNMRIEYRAPLHLHSDTQTQNYEILFQHQLQPVQVVGKDASALAALGEAYHRREDVRDIPAMAAAAYHAPDLESRERYLSTAEAWQAVLTQAPE